MLQVMSSRAVTSGWFHWLWETLMNVFVFLEASQIFAMKDMSV